jgi:hypothetical protein
MLNLKFLFLITFVFTSSAQARIDLSGQEDVLPAVAKKLHQIEKQLNNQRLFVTSANFNWPELTEFREDLMFVVAHDPSGPVNKETPQELLPSTLTGKLRVSFSKLESSAFQIDDLVQTVEWTLFENAMEKFIKYRDNHLYVPARTMIRSGLLLGHLDRVKQLANVILKGDEKSRNISLRVIDPVIEKLSQELNHLNVSVHSLQEYNKPPAPEVKTIYQDIHRSELIVLVTGILFIGVFGTVLLQRISKGLNKSHATKPIDVKPEGFDYYAWLKQLETNLHAFKTNEDNLTEEHINLKNLGFELRESRKALNLAENQQDFYLSLDQLNSSAPRLEDYFEKINLKKNAELSRRLVNHIVQLCEAIEARHEISLIESKARGRVPKNDTQMLDMKVA